MGRTTPPTSEQARKGYFQKGPDPRRNTKGSPAGAGKRAKTELLGHRADLVKRLLELSKQDEYPRVALEAVRIALTITDGPIDTQNQKGGEDPDSVPLTAAEQAELECPPAPPLPDNVLPMPAPAAPKEMP